MTVLFYIGSVVLANLFAARFGPYASILSAFLMIGATLTLRDRLHDLWRWKQLPLRMGLLIAVAGAITYLINADAGPVALASCVAFAVSETVDAVAFHLLRNRRWLVRANGSNIPSAAVDSILFPALAFGGFFPLVSLGQFLAKTFGGAVWAWILKRARLVAAAAAFLALPGLAQAQIVSLNGAWIHNDAVNAAAGEVFVAAPPVFSETFELRPYAIVSWNSDASWEPTVLVRLGHSHRFGKWQAGVGAGFIHVPGDSTFRPSFSTILFGPGSGTVRPYAIAALEKPFGHWDVTTFVGVNWTLYFRR
jgi:hypothetical protein